MSDTRYGQVARAPGTSEVQPYLQVQATVEGIRVILAREAIRSISSKLVDLQIEYQSQSNDCGNWSQHAFPVWDWSSAPSRPALVGLCPSCVITNIVAYILKARA